ncbi:unnamed protein product, partial [Brachionus calyciflorus]
SVYFTLCCANVISFCVADTDLDEERFCDDFFDFSDVAVDVLSFCDDNVADEAGDDDSWDKLP